MSIWSDGKPLIGIDLHNPWIRGGSHEVIHQVGHRDPGFRAAQVSFGAKLAAATARSPLRYRPADDIPFGNEWNNAAPTRPGATFTRWISGIAGTKLATTIETPFANASGREVNQNTARRFGADLGRALIEQLREMERVKGIEPSS